MTLRKLAAVVIFVWVSAAGQSSRAGSHLWKVNELFSNSDGRVQFIELHECCGSDYEVYMLDIEVTSRATGSVFVFPEMLERPSTRRYLLLATQGFAELPGAPAPDYIIDDGFLGLDGDVIWYSEARNYDSFTYGPGDLPIDGRTSIQVTDYESDEFTTGENSPTNYQGATGTVEAEAPFFRGDCNGDSGRDVTDAIYLLNSLFLVPQRLPCDDGCDTNDDGIVDISDATAVLQWLFLSGVDVPPPGPSCGMDESDDELSCRSYHSCP